jgi:chaperonin GroES
MTKDLADILDDVDPGPVSPVDRRVLPFVRRNSLPDPRSEPRRKTMKVRPLQDRVIVRRIEEKETAKGGIIIPDTAKEKSQEGEVVSVGNGRILENGTKVALEVKAGDKILFGKYSGTEVKVDGQDLLILREEDVLAVLA